MGKFLLIATTCVWVASGCSSRWAMSEPAYFLKYNRPYEEGEKLPRMAKQMVDARYVAHRTGLYSNVGAGGPPSTVGGEIGLMHYTEPWQEFRGGLAGMLGTGGETAYGGFDGGARIQVPSRVAPFVGVGGFVGDNKIELDADTDGIDNDGDIFVDEYGEMKDDRQWILAGYPELGLHVWLTPRVRLSGLGRYYLTTEGRDSDFWYVGLGISILAAADHNDWNDGKYDAPSWEINRLPTVEQKDAR